MKSNRRSSASVASAIVAAIAGSHFALGTVPLPDYQAHFDIFHTGYDENIQYWIGSSSSTPMSGTWLGDNYWYNATYDEFGISGFYSSTAAPGTYDGNIDAGDQPLGYILGGVNVTWDFSSGGFSNGDFYWGPLGSDEPYNQLQMSGLMVDGVYDTGTSTQYPATFTHGTTPIYVGTTIVGAFNQGVINSSTTFAGNADAVSIGAAPQNVYGGTVVLGYLSGSRGEFNASADVYAGLMYVGQGGEGHFNQLVGSNFIGSYVDIGEDSTATGVFNFESGTVSLDGDLKVGVNGTGSYVQGVSATSTTIGGNVYVAQFSGATGTITINGGSFTVANSLVVSHTAGTINLHGGTLSAGAMENRGTYNQTAGSATFGAITGNGTMNVSGGALTATSITQHQLSLSGTASVQISGTSTTSTLDQLTFSGSSTAPTATLDLGNIGNALVIDYTSSSPIGTIRNLINSARDGGLWDGIGIGSSDAAAHSLDVAGVGYGEASVILGITGTDTADFCGVTVDATSLLLRVTYVGDLNLDGVVDSTDEDICTANQSMTGATWADGDFNFDGVVDSTDLQMLEDNLGFGSGMRSSRLLTLTPVPEPGGIIAAAVASTGLLWRRKRPSIR